MTPVAAAAVSVFDRLTKGLGRRVAALTLVLFALVQAVDPTVFDVPRRMLFDSYQTWMPRSRDHDAPAVVIVTIDDKTLDAEGRWPWTHDRVGNLVQAILAQHPAALGLDMFLPLIDPGATPPAGPSAKGPAVANPDEVMAKALAGGPAVMGVIGVVGVGCQPVGEDTGPFAGVQRYPQTLSLKSLPCFAATTRSSQTIDLAASGHGVLSTDPDSDGVFRRLHLLSMVYGEPAPSLALDTWRLARGGQGFTLKAAVGGGFAVGTAPSSGPPSVPIDGDGSALVDFTSRDMWTVCSAEPLLHGKPCLDPSTGKPIPLDGAVVLLGVEAAGVSDQLRPTPVGPMAGVEVQAQGLQNLLDGQFARRPTWARHLEPLLTLVLGFFLIAALPRAKAIWREVVTVVPIVLLMVAGAVIWWRLRALVDVATPTIGYALTFVALLGGGLAEVDAQRRRLNRELEIGRLAAARAEGELEAGRRIQMGILPLPTALAPDPRFDLDAVMEPARQIGGDLYDFFKIDPDHLFIAVGDVSGKGLPASLFMALGKALCKSCALRGESDIGAIVRTANAEISRDNPEMLFITLFAGVIDLRTGVLAFCNAGHDAPILIRAGEVPAPLPYRGGPPLCIVDDFDYESEVWTLAPGDLLCVTTDGVTEAMTEAGELMGRDKVEHVLGAMPITVTAHDMTRGLQAAVADFVAGADPSDDLTILTLRWNGP